MSAPPALPRSALGTPLAAHAGEHHFAADEGAAGHGVMELAPRHLRGAAAAQWRMTSETLRRRAAAEGAKRKKHASATRLVAQHASHAVARRERRHLRREDLPPAGQPRRNAP